MLRIYPEFREVATGEFLPPTQEKFFRKIENAAQPFGFCHARRETDRQKIFGTPTPGGSETVGEPWGAQGWPDGRGPSLLALRWADAMAGLVGGSMRYGLRAMEPRQD